MQVTFRCYFRAWLSTIETRLLLSGHHSMGDALHKQERPVSNKSALSFCVIAAIIFALLAGCGYSGPTNSNTPVALSGNVHGGRQPVSGSTIQLYAAGQMETVPSPCLS